MLECVPFDFVDVTPETKSSVAVSIFVETDRHFSSLGLLQQILDNEIFIPNGSSVAGWAMAWRLFVFTFAMREEGAVQPYLFMAVPRPYSRQWLDVLNRTESFHFSTLHIGRIEQPEYQHSKYSN